MLTEKEMLALMPPGSTAYYHGRAIKVGGVFFDGVERRYIGTDDGGGILIVPALMLEAKKEDSKPLPTIEEMSGLVHDFTDGMSLKEYMERIND